jgi:ATP adenylyltransferase
MRGSMTAAKAAEKPCRFCGLAALDASAHLRDRWVAHSEHFVVIPSVGALVDGWVLVVPKSHLLSLGALPEELQPELADLAATMSESLEREYGQPVTRFEHGSSAAMQAVGCGVNHAHLHLVPLTFDVVADLALRHPDLAVVDHRGGLASAPRRTRSGSYVYVRNGSGREVLILDTENESQLVRRMIASRLGVPGRWNWRDYPDLDRADRCGSRLARAREHLVGSGA